jgi:hypothetical protein
LGLDVLISSITTHMIHTMIKSQCCALYQEGIQVKIIYWCSFARRDIAKRLGCKNLGESCYTFSKSKDKLFFPFVFKSMLQLVKHYSLLKHHLVPLLHNMLILVV